jgi:hypothetical protein
MSPYQQIVICHVKRHVTVMKTMGGITQMVATIAPLDSAANCFCVLKRANFCKFSSKFEL